MNNKPNVWTFVFVSVVASLLGCSIEGIVGQNDDDLRESQMLVERYLEKIKNQDYDGLQDFTTDQLRSLVTPENLKTNIEDSLEGESIQSWSLKSHQIVQSTPRYIHLRYEVKSKTRTVNMDVTTELIPSPWRWKIAGVSRINDEVAVENGNKAGAVANQFLQHLRSSAFAEAYQLTSPLFQKNTPEDELVRDWTKVQESTGAIQRWTLKDFRDASADFSGARQHYTMLIYGIEGLKGHAVGVVTMLKTESGWKVEGIRFSEIHAL